MTSKPENRHDISQSNVKFISNEEFMYPFKRLLVALDNTALDETLINYASAIVNTMDVEKVYFFHVAKSLDLPEGLSEKYPDLLAPVDESLTHDFQVKIDKHFKSNSCASEIVLKEGNAADQVLRWSEIKAIDLLIVGRKIQLKGQGVISGRLARVAHCSILFVPENANPQMSSILIPIDFSRNSSMALDTALEIKKANDAKIMLQNAFHVPWGYHTTGKTFEEFAEVMKEHATNDAKKYLKKHELELENFELVLSLDKDDNPAECAYEEAIKNHADLIIMSSKGRSGLAHILLGSVAEKMMKLDANIPLMVVKNKKENMGFFEALMKV